MLRSTFKTMVAVATFGALSACMAPSASTSTYYGSQALQAAEVQYGTITSGRHVELRNTKGDTDMFAGAALGGVAGALIGDQFGKGTGNTIMTGAGAIAGAALGSNAAKKMNRSMAQEWIVKLDSGRSIAVVQDDPSLSVGTRVSVVQNRTETRIVPLM